MAVSHWLLAGAIFIVIIFLILGIGWWIRNHPQPQPPNKYTTPLTWGQITQGPDPDKNQCQLYTFPASKNSNGKVFPGNPTFNTLILNSLQGEPLNTVNQFCTDIDQLYATEVQHECTAPLGVTEGQISLCHLMTGGVTGIGGTEVFYSNAFCPLQIPCVGQLAVIALDYHPENPLTCIQNTDNGTVMKPCDPSNENQLFRVTRTAIGINPLTLTSDSPQNGLLAQIYDRNSGLCLSIGSEISNTIYTPNYVSCTGTVESNLFMGPNVMLTQCTGITGAGPDGATGAMYPGFNWAFFPSMRYCSYPGGGCGGKCSGSCNQCYQIYNQNACTGPPNCYDCNGHPYLITPPQISYIADINITQLPYGIDASYAGLTGSSATVQWLIDNKVRSLYYGGAGESFILKPFGLNSNWCPDTAFVAQYINIATYNTISHENVCYAEGATSTSCINF